MARSTGKELQQWFEKSALTRETLALPNEPRSEYLPKRHKSENVSVWPLSGRY